MLLEKRGELSFLEAAKIILNNNDNKPMSANEIWDEIVSSGLNNKIAYKETRPADSLYYMLLKSSVNSGIKSQYKTKNFEIVGDNPKRFFIIDPVQDFDDEEETNTEDSDSDIFSDYDNKGKYSIEELKEKLEWTFENNPRIATFIKILLSENKKFDREEIKEELYKNGYGKSVGSAGYVLAGISNFVSNQANDHLRQILEYDLTKWNP